MADAVGALPGCEGVTILQDDNAPFIESIGDAAAHRASTSLMPGDILSALIAVLDGPPDESAYSIVTRP